jgi:hypothetical protein
MLLSMKHASGRDENLPGELQHEIDSVEQGLEVAAYESGIEEQAVDESEAELEAAAAGEASAEELNELQDAINALQNGEMTAEEAADLYREHFFSYLIALLSKVLGSSTGRTTVNKVLNFIRSLRKKRRPM